MDINTIMNHLFALYSTWIIRHDDTETLHSSVSSAVSTSVYSSSTLSDFKSRHTHDMTPSVVSTLHDSSVGAFDSDEVSVTSHSTYCTKEPDLKERVIGRVDYEKCICELLPKFSKSQCSTQASRLFDKVLYYLYCFYS
jgi:hypothetical protein